MAEIDDIDCITKQTIAEGDEIDDLDAALALLARWHKGDIDREDVELTDLLLRKYD